MTTAPPTSISQLKCHNGTVWDVSPTGRGTVFTCSTDKSIMETDWRTNTKVGTAMQGHTSWVLSVSCAGNYLCSSDEHRNVRIWSVGTHALLRSLTVPMFGSRALSDIWAVA